VFENENYTLFLRGHFYCKAAQSLDPRENLRLLLGELGNWSSLAGALSTVAGGMFALFVIDHQRGLLQATSDRLGYAPVYYRQGPGGVEFSNNQFAFQDSAAISDVAVCEFLKYGHLPFSDSLFETVRRIRPGQILTVTLRPSVRLEVESRPYRSYLPPEERVQHPGEGAERLAAAFDKYFSRLGAGRGVIGLSGGYDSRLIAAYTAGFDVSLFNFGNPSSREVQLAQQVADRLGRPLDSFPIPDDAVSQYGDQFQSIMLTLDSFEDAHVLSLAKRVAASKASYFVDGFGGDSVVGSNYFYKLSGGNSGLLANLRVQERFESPVRDVPYYVDALYANKRAVPDAALCGSISDDVRDALRSRARQFVDAHLPWCPTHEDLAESLTQVTRGRCLIAGGPVAVSAYTLCPCPFIDHEVFDVAMSCAKHVRAGDRLYNAFWRHRFPDLADIPKGNTGGRAQDGDRTYRLKHLATAIMNREVYPRLRRLTRGRWDRTDHYSSVEGYLTCPANQLYLKELAARSSSRLPVKVASTLLTKCAKGMLDPTVTLRFGTLMAYLGAL
jgi:hypothetical protein